MINELKRTPNGILYRDPRPAGDRYDSTARAMVTYPAEDGPQVECFAWPGGYSIFYVTDDGGTLCGQCVQDEWEQCTDDDSRGSGWFVEGFTHDGETDDPGQCDHCGRTDRTGPYRASDQDPVRYAEIGTVSHGTMQPDHFVPAFIDAYALHNPWRANELYAEWATLSANPDNRGDRAWEKIHWFVGQLFDLLDAAAPDGVTFGAHEGDGADYGFWPIESEDEEDDDDRL